MRPAAGQAAAAATDAAALVLFAVAGLAAHDGGLPPGRLATYVLSLLAGWAAVALLLGTYARPSLRRLLGTWALGVPLGVVVRALLLGRGADAHEAAFLATALAFTLVLVGAGRGLLALARGGAPLGWRRRAASPPRSRA